MDTQMTWTSTIHTIIKDDEYHKKEHVHYGKQRNDRSIYKDAINVKIVKCKVFVQVKQNRSDINRCLRSNKINKNIRSSNIKHDLLSSDFFRDIILWWDIFFHGECYNFSIYDNFEFVNS